MTLATLILVADKTLPVAIYLKSPDGKTGNRYNFTEHKWDDTPLTVDKIRIAKKFRHSIIYRKLAKYELETFALLATNGVSTLTDEQKKQFPKVLTITVSKPHKSKLTFRPSK